jgi:molybdopterin-binding protein
VIYIAVIGGWGPIANAKGPVGDYVKQLSLDRLETLAAAVRRAYLPVSPMALARWLRPHGRPAAWSRNPVKRGVAAMKLSARNQIKGTVVEVRKGTTTAHVRIDIGNGVVITSSITNEAVDDLGLGVGDEAIAVIKASDVMVAK